MKKHFTVPLLAACVAFMLSACNDKPDTGSPLSPFIVLGPSGNFFYDSGIKMGLFADHPVNADNAPFYVGVEGKMRLDNTVYWGYNQAQATRFMAYAPYDPAYSGQESVSLQIPVDQSSMENFEKANILIGTVAANPSSTGVKINMQHVMSAMVFTFDNRTGDSIVSVEVSGLVTQGTFDLVAGKIEKGTFKERVIPYQKPNGGNTYCIAYIPQEFTPIFRVTLASGTKLNITFNNGCNSYPGMIITMPDIILTESVYEPLVHDGVILELKGVSLRKWTTDCLPSMTALEDYINLADLVNVKTNPKDNNFFHAYLNKVTVTACNFDSKVPLAILEDSTKAIKVWMNSQSGVIDGTTITGPIMGYMNKTSEGSFYISSFYTDYATLGQARTMPCTEGSFESLEGKMDSLEYRRMMFRNVTLKELTAPGIAVFSQNGVDIEATLYCEEPVVMEGTHGNLIAFPTMETGKLSLMVFDNEQFESFSKDYPEGRFMEISAPGLYEIQSDTVIGKTPQDAGDCQFSVTKHRTYLSSQTSWTISNVAVTSCIYDCNGTPALGRGYTVAYCVMGHTEQSGLTKLMQCVKVTQENAWFVDESGINGLIIAL